MPSTLVHVALAALVATALLGPRFGKRSLLVVLGAVAFIDLDAVVGIWVQGAHRSLFHTALLPLVLGAALVWDLRLRESSWLRAEFGPGSGRVAGVAVVAVALAGVGPDLFSNGVNVLYPLHDTFYKVDGHLLLSTKRGVVQTYLDLGVLLPDIGGAGGSGAGAGGGGSGGGGGGSADMVVGTTEDFHYYTGVDPNQGGEPVDVERTFYVLQTGRDLLLVLVGSLVTGARLREQAA